MPRLAAGTSFIAWPSISSVPPLIVYFVSGKWFVRGIAAGAVKG
jgi:ABC-type glycerol-3-phosphate transport system permease component